MDKFKMLSGEELVSQGAKKVNSSLPELGLKDIVPNGSWLEQKQIQCSLEARRHIVEVERIEKCGSLSLADWNEELQLAEVTKKAGGHWQYVGHNIGRQTYLYPEEALYLMEVSCLQLRYNDVTVSIQQAYSLLLKDTDSLIQYKVYASLSRLGYKVLRHKFIKADDYEIDDAEDKLEEYSNSEQSCDVTDIRIEQVENKSINKPGENEVRGTSEATCCKMINISKSASCDNIKNTENFNTLSELHKDERCEMTNVTEAEIENGDMDQKVNALCTEKNEEIIDCQMKDVSSDEKHNKTENADSANTTVSSSKSHQEYKRPGMSKEHKDDMSMEQDTEETRPKITEGISDSLRKDILNCEKNDIADNIDSAASLAQPIRKEHIPEVVTAITEKQTENKELDQKMDEEFIKKPEPIHCQGINENLGNVVSTVNSDEINEESDKHKGYTENINTDHKAGGNISDAVIVQDMKMITDVQSSLDDIEENTKQDDCEIICMETNKDENIVSSSVNLCDEECKETTKNNFDISEDIANSGSTIFIQHKIDLLACRELKPINSDMVHHCITENLPDFYQKQIITVKAPDEQLIPRNVFLNNTAYVLNLENLKVKSITPAPSSSTQAYSVSEEANEGHVRRIRSGYSNESPQIHFNPQFFPNMRFGQQTPQYRPFNYWNQYHWSYPRPVFASMPFRFQFSPRMQPMFRFFPNRNMIPPIGNIAPGTRKRRHENPKFYHLESIIKLALKLKGLVAAGNRQDQNIQALQRLINTYNVRYKARIELSAQLDIVNNEVIVETIDLDDDDQSSSKKKKTEESQSYDENFNAIKQFSLKIKELETKKLLTTRHKRAFSNVVKTFNKSYNADIYVDSNYDVIDRRHIIIASSSDSDCAVEEIPTTMEDTLKPRKSRKLRNPFYILKQLSEKQSPSKSTQISESSRASLKKKFEYSDDLKKRFSKYWLPSEDDFGRAEVPLKSPWNKIDHSEEFLYQFVLRSQPVKYKNWLDAKIAYWESCKEAALKYETQSQNEGNVKLDSIIKPEDCTDLRNVLEKLRIIKATNDIEEECSLTINFDVYNRDVPNFRKTKKPAPHFRVICISESSTFPSGVEFATLHSKYEDDVGILFAIVGASSISYLQMNPVDLPIYLPSNNLA